MLPVQSTANTKSKPVTVGNGGGGNGGGGASLSVFTCVYHGLAAE